MKRDIQILTGQVLAADCRKTIAQATPRELYNAVSKAALGTHGSARRASAWRTFRRSFLWDASFTPIC